MVWLGKAHFRCETKRHLAGDRSKARTSNLAPLYGVPGAASDLIQSGWTDRYRPRSLVSRGRRLLHADGRGVVAVFDPQVHGPDVLLPGLRFVHRLVLT